MASAKASTSASGSSSTAEVHQLIQHVARAFYDTKQVVLLDQMVRAELAYCRVPPDSGKGSARPFKQAIRLECVRDEQLATKMGVNVKELKKIAHPLLQQRLLAEHVRNELREGAQKAVPRTWYYLDLKTFLDVVKWRMYKVRKTIDDKQRDEIKTQGYDCPLCKKSFSTLDVLHLEMDMAAGFKCDVCTTVLIDNESAAEAELGKTKIRRLLDQCNHVLVGLKKTETIVLPALDVKKWLSLNHPVAESATITKDVDGLKVAQGGAKASEVKIEMREEEDAMTLKAKMEADAEARRTQNALPSWIAKSTISGALTEAGAREAQAAMLAEADARQKTAVTEASDDGDAALKAYYARLAAQSQPRLSPVFATTSRLPSGAPSPAARSAVSEDLADSLFEGVSPGEATATPPSSYANSHEEEQAPLAKPLNGNGKRSREPSVTLVVSKQESDDDDDLEIVQQSKKFKAEDQPVAQPVVSMGAVGGAASDDSDDEGDFEQVA